MSSTSITRPGQAQTDQAPHVPRSQSHFTPYYQLYGTHRFGEYTPHFVAELVPDDQRVKFRAVHNLRSYNLKSPMMSDLSCKKDYFAVPKQAILPFNWEKVYKNPVLGDDVPDDAGCVVLEVLAKVEAGFNALNKAPSTNGFENFLAIVEDMVFASYFASEGSLISTLGASLASYLSFISEDFFGNLDSVSVDKFVDEYFARVIEDNVDNDYLFIYQNETSDSFYVVPSAFVPESFNRLNHQVISLREWWFMMLDQPDFDSNHYTRLGYFNISVQDLSFGRTYSELSNPLRLDFERLLAYNLVCAHYYSNDHIDYIYSADLYRQLMGMYAYELNNSYDTFTYNGVTTQYDFLSAHYISQHISNGNLQALSCIFNFHRSLKYVDMLTGSRARPLAVGNTDVAVVNNAVDIVDVTRNIQRQRFLNAVNRAGAKVEEYIQGIFGVKPAYDFHNPAFLAHTADEVHQVEVENTGSAQFTQENSVNGVLRSNAEKYMFETNADRPTILIGITYYDIPRVYAHSIDRNMLHKDRYDQFLPEMQFVGDQPVYKAEFSSSSGEPLSTFGYEGRYQEYKMRLNRSFGGFNTEKLRSWAFTQSILSEKSDTISPDFIRSRQSDLDPYFQSLTGFSLASYFHFIVVNTNFFEADRPMVKKPQIL